MLLSFFAPHEGQDQNSLPIAQFTECFILDITTFLKNLENFEQLN